MRRTLCYCNTIAVLAWLITGWFVVSPKLTTIAALLLIGAAGWVKKLNRGKHE